MLSDANARLGAARRLRTRRARHDSRLFLAEGLQAVREALAADRVVELFATAAARSRHKQLLSGHHVAEVSDKAAAALSETVSPQGLVAVCRMEPPALELTPADRLVVVLVAANDPGNAGTILRTADAAGATTVIFAGDTVDPYNGKCVRASAGSIFHLRVQLAADPVGVLTSCQIAGLQTLATTGSAEVELDELIRRRRLSLPTAWIFGNEANGLDEDLVARADLAVRVPIFGAAESLNLSAAAAVCLYASAMNAD